MKDENIQNNFHETQDHLHDDVTKSERTDNHDADLYQNNEKSGSEASTELKEEIQASTEKKEVTEEQREAFDTQEEAASKEAAFDNEKSEEFAESARSEKRETSDVRNEKAEIPKEEEGQSAQQYSCSYTPPYYIPNFTVSEPNENQVKAQKKERKSGSSKGVAIIAIAVVLCLLVSFVVGSYAGYKAASYYGSGSVVEGDNGVTVIKNDGSIKVNEKVGSTGYSNLSVSGVVDLVADNVVEIFTSQVQTDIFYGQYITSGAGSGVIITENGYIITNNHVIEGATEIYVRLTDGSEYKAECIGGDADYDIAVIKIEAAQAFPPLALGKSSELQVGESVVAIGNPLGSLGGTVTNGIISALDRKVTVDGHQMTLLQTNTAINPGNSGGGLFNMAGELIGVVNAKQSDTGIEGLGFAIPIDVAWNVAKDIMEHGYVTGKPFLGFSVQEDTDGFVLRDGWYYYSYPAGVYIVETSNSQLAIYDRIVSIDGITINSISDYYAAINEMNIGDTFEITISRRDGQNFKESKVNITVTEYVPQGS